MNCDRPWLYFFEIAEVKQFFSKAIKTEPDISVGVVAIRTLMHMIEKYKGNTLQGLHENLKEGIQAMKTSDHPVTAINSGCELFMRFITLAKLDSTVKFLIYRLPQCNLCLLKEGFEECKQTLLSRGKLFLKNLQQSRNRIVKLASKFIVDGSVICQFACWSSFIFKTVFSESSDAF